MRPASTHPGGPASGQAASTARDASNPSVRAIDGSPYLEFPGDSRRALLRAGLDVRLADWAADGRMDRISDGAGGCSDMPVDIAAVRWSHGALARLSTIRLLTVLLACSLLAACSGTSDGLVTGAPAVTSGAPVATAAA